MTKGYQHFDLKEGTLIYWWRKEQLSLRKMGRRLRRSHTSIRRELRRNRWCGQHYYPRGAPLWLPSTRASTMGAPQNQTGPRVYAAEITYRLDPRIDRGAHQAARRAALGVP